MFLKFFNCETIHLSHSFWSHCNIIRLHYPIIFTCFRCLFSTSRLQNMNITFYILLEPRASFFFYKIYCAVLRKSHLAGTGHHLCRPYPRRLLRPAIYRGRYKHVFATRFCTVWVSALVEDLKISVITAQDTSADSDICLRLRRTNVAWT